jgi:ribosomal subunit interface protein
MHLEVTFKNLKPREEVKKRAQALYKKLERFLDSASEGVLVLDVEHGQAILELVVTVKGEVHKAVEEDPELRAALDKVFHTMEIQLRRGKERRLAGRREVEEQDGFVPEV